MHALEHDLAIDTLHIQHALVSQQAFAVDLQDAAEEIFEPVRIKGAVTAEYKRLDLVVVMRVVVIRVTMLMVVAVIVAAGGMVVIVLVCMIVLGVVMRVIVFQ